VRLKQVIHNLSIQGEKIVIMAERQTLSPLLLCVPDYYVLQQLCRDHETEEGVNYNRYERLDNPLETLKDFVDLLRSADAIWIAHSGAFVSFAYQDLPGSYQDFRFVVSLKGKNKENEEIRIYASTTQHAIACLEFLVRLPDSWYTDIFIGQKKHNGPDRTCLLTNHQLGRMLQNSKRSTAFMGMVFTVEHSRVLATCGLKSELQLINCSGEDGGASFVRSYAEGNGPSKLRFARRLPFSREHWALLLNQQNPPESIELSFMSLDLESSRAVAAAGLQSFVFDQCRFEDEGASLIESVRTGLGPHGLSFLDTKPFTTLERWMSFMNALEENNGSLKFLKIWNTAGGDEIHRALAVALRKNNGLVALNVRVTSYAHWMNVLQPISAHPAIRKLDLSFFDARNDERMKRLQTRAAATMLLVSTQVEDIEFYGTVYDRMIWDTRVAPRLEYNIYRKRFPAIQKVGDTSTRAALLGAAMGRVRTKPSLLYMLLCDNRDTVVSHLHLQAPLTTMRPSSVDGYMWN
jgi:hypothetical protein